MRYDSKFSTLEEQDDLTNVTVDELHGILTAYEMRTGQFKNSKKEAAFKVTSKNQSENIDDEEALFVSRLNKGNEKYKGKLPLKCFNYGRIGHFSHKCSYPKQEESDHEESCCHKGRNKYKEKNNFYSNEESEVEETKVLFMGLDTQASNSDSDTKGEVDLRDERVSALEELEKCRKKNI